MPRYFRNIIFIAFAAFMLQQNMGCKQGQTLSRKVNQGNDSLANFPYWIAMMDSPKVNYYSAIAAFDKYWEHRDKPTEDDGEAKDIYGKQKSKTEKESEDQRSVQYVYEYKRFLNWEQTNKNLVKPDGTLMSPQEILDQWKKSQNDTIKR